MRICDYGCGQKAKHQLKNGIWCCSESHNSCQVMRKKNSIKNLGKIRSVECIERNRISQNIQKQLVEEKYLIKLGKKLVKQPKEDLIDQKKILCMV